MLGCDFDVLICELRMRKVEGGVDCIYLFIFKAGGEILEDATVPRGNPVTVFL